MMAETLRTAPLVDDRAAQEADRFLSVVMRAPRDLSGLCAAYFLGQPAVLRSLELAHAFNFSKSIAEALDCAFLSIENPTLAADIRALNQRISHG